jgi:hypothetical protein
MRRSLGSRSGAPCPTIAACCCADHPPAPELAERCSSSSIGISVLGVRISTLIHPTPCPHTQISWSHVRPTPTRRYLGRCDGELVSRNFFPDTPGLYTFLRQMATSRLPAIVLEWAAPRSDAASRRTASMQIPFSQEPPGTSRSATEKMTDYSCVVVSVHRRCLGARSWTSTPMRMPRHLR